MIYFPSIPLFLLGLAIGSFLNCVIYRLHTHESFLRGFSHCPYCQHKLNWQDLIPILSFIFLKGKCRYCYKSISPQYPLVELSTGFLFLLIFQNLHENLQGLNSCYFLYLLVITCFLIIIFVYDLKHYIIPDKIVYPAIIIAFLYQFFFPQYTDSYILNPLFSALGATGFFFLIWFFSRGKWLGFGDVKLVFLIGLLLGFPKILAALFLAFFIGAIIGIGLIITGKKQLSSQVPFGPFLVTGTFLALFFGENLIGLYLNLIQDYIFIP